MKKLLLVTLDFWPKTGGVASYYFNLCQSLGERVVVLTDGEIKEGKDNKLGFKIYRKNLLSKFIWPRWWKMFYYIFRIVKKEKIGTIWVGEVLPTGTVVYFLSRILGYNYVVSCHGTDVLSANKSDRKRKIASQVLKNAKWVVANSEYTRGLVIKMGVEEDGVRVVYPGISIISYQLSIINSKKEFIKKYKLKGKRILLSVGRLVERKGFDNVIRSLPRVWEEIPDLVYVIVGAGADADRLAQLARPYEDKILFIDKFNQEAKWNLFNKCDVFISPGRKVGEDVEGFGIVFLEAASCAKPVIAGKAGGTPEAVIDGETGILVDGEDIEKIAQVIIKLFKDEKLRKELGEKGKERADREFRWEESAHRLGGLLD